jgi:NAD-dependent deacetylase
LIKPNVVLFSESPPANVFEEARRELLRADLVIVVGSSISVFPAAALPYVVNQTGAPLIIVNDEPTPLDTSAEVVIHGKAGEVFPQILNALNE